MQDPIVLTVHVQSTTPEADEKIMQAMQNAVGIIQTTADCTTKPLVIATITPAGIDGAE